MQGIQNINAEELPALTDSYKLAHWMMNRPGTENIYSNFEARTGALYNKTVFFGPQFLFLEFLCRQITKSDIADSQELTFEHLGDAAYFNKAMWDEILQKHDGFIPLRVKAVAEGTPVDVNNVLMTAENTGGPITAPITQHFETLLSHVWAPSTVATLSYEVKMLCKHYLEVTGGSPEALAFMLHDFGFRGTNQCQAAGICGAAHLINFMGTDTIIGMQYARKYYNAPLKALAYSILATEHSVMTQLGEEGEEQILIDLLTTFKKGLLAIVIDSYNYRRFMDVYVRRNKHLVLARDGKTVFRPDSGVPVSVSLEVMGLLGDIFGTTKNKAHYLQLHPKAGEIWGDGIEYAGVRDILHALKDAKWCADNMCFGMGGGLHQKMHRDIQRFAFKCSWIKRNGIGYDIFKRPLEISKASKRGRLALVRGEDGAFQTIPDEIGAQNHLETVFENGKLMRFHEFKDIRARAALV